MDVDVWSPSHASVSAGFLSAAGATPRCRRYASSATATTTSAAATTPAATPALDEPPALLPAAVAWLVVAPPGLRTWRHFDGHWPVVLTPALQLAGALLLTTKLTQGTHESTVLWQNWVELQWKCRVHELEAG